MQLMIISAYLGMSMIPDKGYEGFITIGDEAYPNTKWQEIAHIRTRALLGVPFPDDHARFVELTKTDA